MTWFQVLDSQWHVDRLGVFEMKRNEKSNFNDSETQNKTFCWFFRRNWNQVKQVFHLKWCLKFLHVCFHVGSILTDRLINSSTLSTVLKYIYSVTCSGWVSEMNSWKRGVWLDEGAAELMMRSGPAGTSSASWSWRIIEQKQFWSVEKDQWFGGRSLTTKQNSTANKRN